MTHPFCRLLGKTLEVTAKESGYVHRILAEDIGIACMTLGGGRETKESAIDLSVGIILEKKNGDAVSDGEVLATIYGNVMPKCRRRMKKLPMPTRSPKSRRLSCRWSENISFQNKTVFFLI